MMHGPKPGSPASFKRKFSLFIEAPKDLVTRGIKFVTGASALFAAEHNFCLAALSLPVGHLQPAVKQKMHGQGRAYLNG